MALSDAIRDMEHAKFDERNGKRAVRVLDVDDDFNTSLDFVKTIVTTTAIQLVFPEGPIKFNLFHESTATLFLKQDNTVSTSDIPIYFDDVLELNLQDNDNNELWAISSIGSITVFIMGEIQA